MRGIAQRARLSRVSPSAAAPHRRSQKIAIAGKNVLTHPNVVVVDPKVRRPANAFGTECQ